MKLNIMNTTISVLLLLILVGVYNLPNHVYKLIEKKYEQKGNKQLQIESYFKQLGGKKQEEILSKWTDFLTNMEETLDKYTKHDEQSTKLLMELMHDTIMYGSDRTLKYVAYFRELASEDTDDDQVKVKDDEDNWENQIYVVLMGCIVSNLKEDFTGYKSDPLDLLKITILDYDNYDNIYRNILDKVLKELE